MSTQSESPNPSPHASTHFARVRYTREYPTWVLALALDGALLTGHTTSQIQTTLAHSLSNRRMRESAQAGIGASGNWRKWEWGGCGLKKVWLDAFLRRFESTRMQSCCTRVPEPSSSSSSRT
jgi:hypothetical protein